MCEINPMIELSIPSSQKLKKKEKKMHLRLSFQTKMKTNEIKLPDVYVFLLKRNLNGK